MTPGQRGRRIGRLLLAVAVVMVMADAFFYIAAPKFPGGPIFINAGGNGDGVPADVVFLGVAAVLMAVGLVWMVRIHRADPEPDQHAWRYRERE